ncbi:hypothetical protein D9M68_726130 [compost metagenome]
MFTYVTAAEVVGEVFDPEMTIPLALIELVPVMVDRSTSQFTILSRLASPVSRMPHP